MSHLPSYICRRRDDGRFYNTCGKRLSYTRWNTGEPNDVGKKENCGHMYTNNLVKSKWNDIPCNFKYGYICEIKLPRCRYLVFHLCKTCLHQNLNSI